MAGDRRPSVVFAQSHCYGNGARSRRHKARCADWGRRSLYRSHLSYRGVLAPVHCVARPVAGPEDPPAHVGPLEQVLCRERVSRHAKERREAATLPVVNLKAVAQNRRASRQQSVCLVDFGHREKDLLRARLGQIGCRWAGWGSWRVGEDYCQA